MKRKYYFLFIIMMLLPVIIFAGCQDMSQQSIKSITSPYIATYECVEGRFGNDNLLERFEFIKITLLDKKELELSFKEVGKEKKAKTFPYTFDFETKEISVDETILGNQIMEKVKIVDGEFIVKKTLGNKTLILKFRAS